MNKIIEMESVSKIYRTTDIETTALDKIHLSIYPGEFVSIMGPSGCGKTSLLQVLGMLSNPGSGKYLFMGQDVSKASESERARLRKSHLGFVFQNFNLIDELSVFANVELPLVYGGVAQPERIKRVEHVLEMMEISHRSKHFPQQLSGGQQQRVALARALVNNPALILADEPTGNLDSRHGEEVMRIFNELNKNGVTILMVTHSQDDAARGGRVISMLDGRIVG